MSNNWTILLNGEIDLSVSMTFASTVASLFLMPVWFYGLGKSLATENESNNLDVPFSALISNLLLSILPCLLGLFVVTKFPKLKNLAIKVSKPFGLFGVVSVVIFSCLVKYHIYSLITFKMWFCVGIPWMGFLISGVVAYLFKFSKKQIITITVETGIQNAAIPFLVILTNFPSPDAGKNSFNFLISYETFKNYFNYFKFVLKTMPCVRIFRLIIPFYSVYCQYKANFFCLHSYNFFKETFYLIYFN